MIKVTIAKCVTECEKSFPKLMKHSHSDLIVFFANTKSGIVIQADIESKYGDDRPVGMYRTDWCEENFIDYNTPLTIMNN